MKLLLAFVWFVTMVIDGFVGANHLMAGDIKGALVYALLMVLGAILVWINVVSHFDRS